MHEISFSRPDIAATAAKLGIKEPKNLGDVLYSARHRSGLPQSIQSTQPEGQEWVIEGAGPAKYAFRLRGAVIIAPNPNLAPIKIPDATPEIVTAHALSDEQALLAIIRYNRLIDVFLGIVTYSLQNHLRTAVKGVGQIEIDELYVGLSRRGRHYIVPVQAKGGADRLSTVQARQGIAYCESRFPNLICRPVSAQFVTPNHIALFDLVLDENDDVRIDDERQYRLVPAEEIQASDLHSYGTRH